MTVNTLAKLGPFALQALPDLMITATNDSDWSIRLAAIRAIGSMGPVAKEAIPLLSSLTNTELNQIPSEILDSIKDRHAIDLRN
jgi:HEAT repeat protein